VVAQQQGREAVPGGKEVGKVEESISALDSTLHKLKKKLFKH
jgi:hypothetical protein